MQQQQISSMIQENGLPLVGAQEGAGFDDIIQNDEPDHANELAAQMNIIGKFPFNYSLIKLFPLDYTKHKVSQSYVYMDEEMHDSDCSEEYDTDPFFQQSGRAYFKQMQELKQQLILADREAEEPSDKAAGAEDGGPAKAQ